MIEYYFVLRMKEHVEDASKNPILIFPEGILFHFFSSTFFIYAQST